MLAGLKMSRDILKAFPESKKAKQAAAMIKLARENRQMWKNKGNKRGEKISPEVKL
jgi:hypothetical protein